MSVNIPTYMLASGMIAGGMNWKQAIFTVFLGNLIVLVPMLLNAHAGARYGIPFPVFARSSFGVLGANIPAVLRALVACGWFGIQTWIGGEAINTLLAALMSGWNHPWLCFFLFWLLNLAVILRGIDTIRYLQGIAAPVLLVLGLAMLAWAYVKAGGFGPMLSTPSKFHSFEPNRARHRLRSGHRNTREKSANIATRHSPSAAGRAPRSPCSTRCNSSSSSRTIAIRAAGLGAAVSIRQKGRGERMPSSSASVGETRGLVSASQSPRHPPSK